MTAAHEFRSQRRHRLCPECGFDLAGSLDAGVDRCPECGESFTYHELVREVRPGDWTPIRAVRRFCLGLLWRGAVLVVAWLVLLALTLQVMEGSNPAVIVIAALLGVAAARIGFTRLEDRAGFESPWLAALASLTVAAAFAVGLFVAGVPHALPGLSALMIWGAGVVPAVAVIVRRGLLDPDDPDPVG